MDIFSVFSLLGGLALFLYGMQQMGDSLEKAASDKLEEMLKRLTSSRLRGMLLGAGITAIIQSSSATTVTVVGFVNSGIMKLNQAISVIMGANVGTTITAWILSLTGIQGDNFLVQLLKPTSFTPILAVLGIAMIMFAKKDRTKEFGRIFIGFAILMFGMDTMSNAMKPLANMPQFAQALLWFQNPVLGMLVGAVLTGVIQSSSASIGILQALALSGGVTYGAAIPIIMGQNIGTCVTSLIASIGANKNARRAAMVHLYFNLIGTFVFLVLFIIVKSLLHPALLAEPIGVMGIAVVHSAFNLMTTAMLAPFTNQLEKLAMMTIRDEPSQVSEKTVLLDERLLATPSFALPRCKEVTDDMARLARENLSDAISLIRSFDKAKAERVFEMEEHIDVYEDIIGSFLVKLSARNLAASESHQVSQILHSIGDFERISDHALNLSEVAQEIHDKKVTFSQTAQRELDVLISAVEEILDTAIRTFLTGDIPLAKWVEPLEEVIDELIHKMKLNHISRLQEGECTIEMGFIFADLMTNLERVADHCSNIAICVIELKEEGFNPHEYLTNLKSDEFDALYEVSKRKYAI